MPVGRHKRRELARSLCVSEEEARPKRVSTVLGTSNQSQDRDEIECAVAGVSERAIMNQPPTDPSRWCGRMSAREAYLGKRARGKAGIVSLAERDDDDIGFCVTISSCFTQIPRRRHREELVLRKAGTDPQTTPMCGHR